MNKAHQLQQLLDSSAARVRELQQKLKVGDKSATMEQVSVEIQRMLAIRQKIREIECQPEQNAKNDIDDNETESSDIAVQEEKENCIQDTNQFTERIEAAEAWMKEYEPKLFYLEGQIERVLRAKEMLLHLNTIADMKSEGEPEQLKDIAPANLHSSHQRSITSKRTAVHSGQDAIGAAKEKEDLQKQILELMENIQKVEDEKIAISKRLRSKRKEADEAQTDLEKAQLTIQHLQSEYDEKNRDLQRANIQLKEECKQLQNTLTDLRGEYDTTRRSFVQTGMKIASLKSDLMSANTEKENLQTELQDMKEAIHSEIRKRDSALEEVRVTNEKFESQIIEMRKLISDTRAMKEAHYAEKMNNERLEKQVEKLRLDLISQEQLVKKSSVAMLRANEELKDAQNGVQKWKTNAQTAKQQLFEKSNEVDRYRKQLSNAQSEFATAIQKSREQAHEIQLLKADAIVSKAELQAAHSKIATLEKEWNTTNTTRSTLLKEKSDAMKRNAQLIKDISRLELYRKTLFTLLPVLTSVVIYCSFIK